MHCKCIAAFLSVYVLSICAYAHPASGIAVDSHGTVYFAQAAVGLWKCDAQGKLAPHPGPRFHLMALDPTGTFPKRRLPRFPDTEIELVRTDTPANLILSSSYPVAVGEDGALYYPDVEAPAPVKVYRVTPAGDRSVVATLPLAQEINYEGNLQTVNWIHGLAVASDGTLVYAEKESVRKIAADGAVTTLAENIEVSDCAHPPAITGDRGGPILRGLCVDRQGNVYVAASACSAVLKITPAGDVTVALRAERPWSPTGVVMGGDTLYALEFTNL